MPFEFPVFVLSKDCGEVEMFNSLESLEKELELIDVENSEYEIWDAQGLRLRLSAQKPTWLKIEEVQPDYDGLKTSVLNYASASGLKISDMETKSLKTIIQAVSAQKYRTSFFRRFLKKCKIGLFGSVRPVIGNDRK